MGGMQGDTQGSSLLSGDASRELGASGVRPSVIEALDTDLDAYLDRELFARAAMTPEPATLLTPAPVQAAVLAPERKEAAETSAPVPSVLELAKEETEWLRQLPPPSVAAEVAPVEPLPVPTVLPPPLAQPSLPSWNAPAVPPVGADRSRRVAWVAAGALLGVAVVGALAAGMLWTGLRLGEAKASRAASVPVAASPAVPVVEAPVAPPAVAPAPVSPSPVSTAEAAPVPASPAPAQAEQAPRADVVAALPASPAETPEVSSPARPVAEPKQGRVRPARTAEDALPEVQPVRATLAKKQAPAEEEAEAAPKKADGYAEFDEDYARELGFTDKPAQPQAAQRKLQNVYIPPEPGEAIPERLTNADIMKVVVSNKASIAGCIQEHRARTEPGTKGQFVARWSVLPDGSTQGATVETAEFQGTPLARCVEGLVKGWKFPRHRVAQVEPIRFPFTF